MRKNAKESIIRGVFIFVPVLILSGCSMPEVCTDVTYSPGDGVCLLFSLAAFLLSAVLASAGAIEFIEAEKIREKADGIIKCRQKENSVSAFKEGDLVTAEYIEKGKERCPVYFGTRGTVEKVLEDGILEVAFKTGNGTRKMKIDPKADVLRRSNKREEN